MAKRGASNGAESTDQTLNQEHQKRNVEIALKAYRQGGMNNDLGQAMRRETFKLAAKHGLRP